MKANIEGLKSKSIVLAQRYTKTDVITFKVIVKAETSVIDFNVYSLSSGIDKTFSDIAEAFKFYGEI